VPQLRVVDDALWQRVKARQEMLRFEIGRDPSGNALNRAHRRHFLLSGLLVCGSCGGGYTIVGPDRYGCAAHRSKGTCINASLISRHKLEDRVLSGLKERMMAPDLVAAASHRAEWAVRAAGRKHIAAVGGGCFDGRQRLCPRVPRTTHRGQRDTEVPGASGACHSHPRRHPPRTHRRNRGARPPAPFAGADRRSTGQCRAGLPRRGR
jgi:hypothetical protein